MRRKTKSRLTTLACVLSLVLLAGLVLNLYGVFKEKVVNPDNLINVKVSGHVGEGSYNNGYGVKYTVETDGTVKASGTATADDVFTLVTGVKLTEGKTYTLGCGNGSVGYQSYGVRLHNTNASSGSADEYVYADLNGTFTAASSTNVYDVEIYVKKGVSVYATFRPILTEGRAVGDFLVKAA